MDPRFKNRIDSDEIWHRVQNAAVSVTTTREVQCSLFFSSVTLLPFLFFNSSMCHYIVIKYILQVANQEEHRLMQEDSDADEVSEQNDEYSDEVMPCT